MNYVDPEGLQACAAGVSFCTTVTATGGLDPYSFCAFFPLSGFCKVSFGNPDPGDAGTQRPPKGVDYIEPFEDLARKLSEKVKKGEMDDCQALANFADFVDVYADKDFAGDAFKVFYSTAFGGYGKGIELTGGKVGYKEEYQDAVNPKGDQAHHFAFFFAHGYSTRFMPAAEAGAAIGMGAAALEAANYFRDWKFNVPDIRLGVAAGMMGYMAGQAKMDGNQSHVGMWIRKELCN